MEIFVSLLSKLQRRTRLLAACLMAAAIAVPVSAAMTTTASAATQGPCDIYAAGGTPCEAAHSTTRALFAAYNGPLYQVQRSSDGGYTNVLNPEAVRTIGISFNVKMMP